MDAADREVRKWRAKTIEQLKELARNRTEWEILVIERNQNSDA